MKRLKSALSMFLAVILVITMMPADASYAQALPPSGTPTVEKGEGDNSNIITISKNGSDVTVFYAMYSAAPPTKDTWYNFTVTGGQRKDINGSKGYEVIKFNASDTYEYTCTNAGYYNFYIDKHIVSISVGIDDIPDDPSGGGSGDGGGGSGDGGGGSGDGGGGSGDPAGPTPTPDNIIITKNNNVITINKNGTSATGAYYELSEARPQKENWSSFVIAGKTNIPFNGTNGYKFLKFGADGTVSYTAPQAGTYYFFALNHVQSVTINSEDITNGGGSGTGGSTPGGGSGSGGGDTSGNTPAPEPGPQVEFSQDGNVILVNKNGASANCVYVELSESSPAKNTWASFVNAGKTNTAFNGSTGYKVVKFTTNEVEYTCTAPGTYYFFANNTVYSFTVTAENIEDNPDTPDPVAPEALVEFSGPVGNVITIDKNGASAEAVQVMFSTDDSDVSTWLSFVTKGKELTDINSKNGYKTVKFTDSIIDYECCYPGTYYFFVQNRVEKYTIAAEAIPAEDLKEIPTPENDVELTQSGNRISIDKNGSSVNTAYVMFSEDAVASNTWTSFVNKGKEHKTINGSLGYNTINLADEVTAYDCLYEGIYNFYVQEKLFSFEIDGADFEENDVSANDVPVDIPDPEPIITINDNVITINKNGLEVDAALSMYTENAYTGTTWTSFVNAGKLDTATNGTKGYSSVKLQDEITEITAFKAGFYNYYINGKSYFVELTSENAPASRYAEIRRDNNVFTVVENGANITSLRYVYTEENPGSVTDEELYELGKEYSENSNLGYVTVSAPYNNKTVVVRKPGFYTFVITDDSGTHRTIYELENENGIFDAYENAAYVDVSGNIVTVHDNGADLTSVIYMYSDDYYFYTDSASFVAKGKEDTDSNTTYGYRSLKKVTTGEGVSTYDGASLLTDVGGYYVFQFTDASGKYGQTIEIEQETIDCSRPEVNVTDNIITMSTADVEGYTLKSAYYINTDENYEYTTWNSYVSAGKAKPDINSTRGYMAVSAVDGTATVAAKAPGYYTLLLNYYNNAAPDKLIQYPYTVLVEKYLSTIKLTLDGLTSDAGAFVPGRDVTNEERDATGLFLKNSLGESTELTKVKKGQYQGVVAAGDEYEICYGNTEGGEKVELGPKITDEETSKTLDFYSLKVTLTDLEGTYDPYALKGETFTIDLTADIEDKKELPRRVTIREEGEEKDGAVYNNRTGHIEIPNVQGRITVKAMAIRGYNRIDVKLNSMGGNIYDAAWTDQGNYNYKAEDLSGENILLPTPLPPANSETVKFDGWYTDINYTTKVTSINSDNYTTANVPEVARRNVTKIIDGVETPVPTDFPVVKLYAKWILSSTTYSGKMYYAYRGNVFDVRGLDGSSKIKTTYSDAGYTNYYSYNNGTAYNVAPNGASGTSYGGTSMTFSNTANQSIFKQFSNTNVYMAQVMASQGSYVTVNYIFVNMGNTDVNNLTFGAAADVQIGTNDSAKITAGTDDNGTFLLMEDGSKYAFRLYTMDADRYWIGGYSSSKNLNNKGYQYNVFNDSSANTNHYDKKFTSGDSALAFSFVNMRIPAGSTVMKTVKFGVGTMAEMGSKSGANITLVGCGGTWNGDAMKFITSSATTATLTAADKPVRDGYEFVEWNTRSDGNGTSYAYNAKVGTATLYAIWNEIIPPSYNLYNNSVVRNDKGTALSRTKAEITIFYDDGENLVDQDSFEVEAIKGGVDFNATLKLNADQSGYCLADTVKVEVGSTLLNAGTDYIYTHDYNSDTAELTIKAAKITDNITITGIGGLKTVKVPTATVTPAVYNLNLKDTLDLELEVTNTDEVNQVYEYRWYKNTEPSTDGGEKTAVNRPVLNISSITTGKAGVYYYYCGVSTTRKDNKQNARVTSNLVTVVVNKGEINSHIIEEKDENLNVTGYHVSSNPGNGKVTYTYYRDAECTIKTDTSDGAGISGGKPTRTDAYYVKAHIAETDNYLSCETPAITYLAAGTPTFTQDGKVLYIYNNDSALKSFKVMYSDSFYEYSTWYNYVTEGQKHKEVNTNSGYRAKFGEVTGVDSTLDNTAFVATKAGYYNFIFTYDNGKTLTTCILVSEDDLLQGVPYVTQKFVAGNEAVLVNNNNNNLASLQVARYIYTGDTEFIPTTWQSFVNKGKEKIKINSSTGYRFVKPSDYRALALVEGTDDIYESVPATEETEGAVLSLDQKEILLSRSGYYTFWLTYTEADNTVKEKTMTLYVGTDKTGVDNTGYNINYYDSITDGKILTLKYQYCGLTDEPDIAAIDANPSLFTADKSITSFTDPYGETQRLGSDSVFFNRNTYYAAHPEESRIEIPFTVDRMGWYVVRVSYYIGTDSYISNYKVYVGDESNEQNKIILVVDGGLIQAFDGDDPTNLITGIRFTDVDVSGNDVHPGDAFKKGNAIIATSTGIFNVACRDSHGYTYIAQANVLTLERSVSTANLESLMATCQSSIDACKYDDDDGYMVKAGTYSTNAAKELLEAEMAIAREVIDTPISQTAVDSEYKTLYSAWLAFRRTMVEIDADLVTVTGDTILIHPSDDGYSLNKVFYNVNNTTDNVLVPETFSNFSGMAQVPYAKRNNFGEEGTMTFVNADNGIYTLSITQNEGDSKKDYIRYAIVHVDETEKETATSELERYLATANHLLENVARGMEAAEPGGNYVPEIYYDGLVSAITSATAMDTKLTTEPDNNLDVYNNIIPEIIALHSAILTFGKKTVTKPLEDVGDIVINSADHTNVTLQRSDLLRASITYGVHTKWNTFGISDYTTYNADEDGLVVYGDAEYNGTYTAYCTYADGGASFEQFEITDIIYPFTITQADGQITIDLDETEATFVGYQYGNKQKKPESDFLEIDLEDGQTEYSVPALGNGVHTVIIKTSDHTYYQTIEVDSCESPVIVQYDGKIGVFNHGFEAYDCIAYRDYSGETGYRTWGEMYSNATYLSPNTWYDPSYFAAGENYTFYFKSTTDGTATQLFKDYTINR